METIIKNRLIEYLSVHQLITKEQHGFISRRSTCTQLLECLNGWAAALTSVAGAKMCVDGIYVDMAKAFDSVSHQKLLFKLSKYGVIEKLRNWLESFLSGRTQRVQVNSALSAQCWAPPRNYSRSGYYPHPKLEILGSLCDYLKRRPNQKLTYFPIF